MKDLFPGYYRPSEEEFKTLWSEGLFILDTNILLNLYTYPEDLRKVYFSVLSKLEQRIWIPYQVALEFHRNRFSRIKQENKRVNDLLKTISETGNKISEEVRSIELEKRNIGITNIDDLLKAVQKAHSDLTDAVSLACEKLPPLSLDDPIGEEIVKLLSSKVGLPPTDQAALDTMLSNANDRYDKKIPPGFSDIKKGEASSIDRGLTYLDKFGDLILWMQILDYARANKIGSIVFVTNDSKKDWWWEEEGKTLGPTPNLVQEIHEAGVDLFWMYSPAQFLEYSESYLKATEVTPEAVKQVKEISSQNVETVNANANSASRNLDWMEFLKILSEGIKRSNESGNDFTSEEFESGSNTYFEKSKHPTLGYIRSNHTKVPAVTVSQDTESGASEIYNRGVLRVNVLRDTIIATGSGKLQPAMIGIPRVRAVLEKMPEGCTTDLFNYSVGTGTTFDFNINIRSHTYKEPLPVGEYVFSYEAKSQ